MTDGRANDLGDGPTIGVVIGAGASVSCGYPLAGRIAASIKEFQTRLAGRSDCAVLQQWCGELITELTTGRFETIDELAHEYRSRNQGQMVLRAKAVITALFADLERTADVSAYCRAVREWIDFSDLRLPKDPSRIRVPSGGFCLSYNYDRCLEYAIRQELAAARSNHHDLNARAVRLMNSGLDTVYETITEIDPSRFALLKMHGTIGTLWDMPGHADGLRGWQIDQFGRVPVDDTLLRAFRRERATDSPTMIYFPWEAGHLHDDAERLLDVTDRGAMNLLARAVELRFIGFSFHPQNQARLERLLRSATNVRVVSVIDPGEESHLRARALIGRLGWEAEIVPFRRTFEA